MAKNSGSEHKTQCALFQWAKFCEREFPELRFMYAVPNGGYRYQKTARLLKAEGVKAGVPDICLPVARRGYCGFYLEMKFGRNKTTALQKEWLEFLEKEGHKVGVYYDWISASEDLKWYLSKEEDNGKT